MQRKLPGINKEKIKQIWKKLNETNVDEILPYLKRNKKQALQVTGGIVAFILLIFLIRLNVNFFANKETAVQPQGTTTPSKVAKEPPSSTFLPETKRVLDQKGDEKQERDPFGGTIKLKGIMVGGGGDNLAIMEMANTAYIAGPGTELPGGMIVKEVEKSQVILESVHGKLYLKFDGRNTIEKPTVKNTESKAETSEKQESGKSDKTEGGDTQ